jgi:hypothetical protein
MTIYIYVFFFKFKIIFKLFFFPIKTCYAYHGIGIYFKIQLESTNLHILIQIIQMFQFDIYVIRLSFSEKKSYYAKRYFIPHFQQVLK